MGGSLSRTSSKTSSPKADKKCSSPDLNNKKLSLEDFVAEMVRQLVEQKVDEIVEEERRNKPPYGSKSDDLKKQEDIKDVEDGLEVLGLNHEFFKTVQAAVGAKISKPTDYQDDVLLSDDELSLSYSNSSTLKSSSSNDDFSESQMALAGIPPDQIVGLIVSIPSRMVPFLNEALQFFWNLRINCKPGTYEKEVESASYPPRFTTSCVETEDVQLCRNADRMGFMNRSLFFDLVREMIQRIYEGEDEDIHMNRAPVLNSNRYRLWHGTQRPNSFVKLEGIVRMNLEQELGINLTPSSQEERLTPPPPPPVIKDMQRLPKLTQWTIQRKRWLDQHLEVEMRSDEATWINYRPFEKSVLDSLTAKILMEAFEGIYERCFRKLKKDIYEEDIPVTNSNLLKEVLKNPDINNRPLTRHPSSISELQAT